MKDVRFGIGSWGFSPTVDRFCIAGYRDATGLVEQLEQISAVEDIEGVELHWPSDFTEIGSGGVKDALRDNGLELAQLNVNLFGEGKWAYGSFTSNDPERRNDAVEIAKQAADVSKELGLRKISFWLGQDGYDYPFQANFTEQWNRLVDGLREVAEYDTKTRVSVEYKQREPRNRITVSTAAKAVLLCRDVGTSNIGVTLDVGHALMAYENPAESIALLADNNMFDHLHFNDNYGDWDDDMMVGSVHLWETLEALYWADRVGYDSWYNLDIYPYRVEPAVATKQSIENIKSLRALLDDATLCSRIEDAQSNPDQSAAVGDIQELLRGLLRK